MSWAYIILLERIGILRVRQQGLVGQGMQKSDHRLFFQGISVEAEGRAVGMAQVVVQVRWLECRSCNVRLPLPA